MQIITKHPLTVAFIITERPDHRVPGFCKCSDLRRIIRVDSKILCDLSGRLIETEIKQSCDQVDHITLRSASEAVIEVRIELKAWMAVIVEETPGHVMAGHGKPVCPGSLRHADTCFNSFKKVHSAFPPSELFGFFILVSYTEKMPGSLKMRRFWDLEEAERVKIAKMQSRPDYGTVICVR